MQIYEGWIKRKLSQSWSNGINRFFLSGVWKVKKSQMYYFLRLSGRCEASQGYQELQKSIGSGNFELINGNYSLYSSKK